MLSVEIREYAESDFPAVLALYGQVGWTNYTKTPSILKTACKNSLCLLTAWREKQLVGLIRAVGDGCTIIYIQDILVSPDSRRQGIGRRLLEYLDEAFPDVRQKLLLTDDLPAATDFYKSCGYAPVNTFNCIAFAKLGA